MITVFIWILQGKIYNQLKDFKMKTYSNPQEVQLSPSFINKSLKNKLKQFSSKQISNFIIRQKIGMGSYAKVYKAIHKFTGEIVAVKILNKNRMTKQEVNKTRFQVETHKKLFHTNIVRIYEFYQDYQKMYIFMENCQNGELFHYINKNGPLSQKFAGKVFKQILSALKYLKSQRISHRDIKCQNIMFDKNWNAKLVDFGFVKIQQNGCFSTTFCGSPSYTAPEMAKRQKYHSQKIDVWCLGVTLYAMISGQLPFDASETKNTRKNIMEIKYEIKKFFSQDAIEVFKKIFVSDQQRVTIEDLQEIAFAQKGYLIHPNFINTNTDEITLDPLVLEHISDQFKINQLQLIQSVTKFKLDSNYSLYYLSVQKQINKGIKIKSDIASPDFEKKKKRSSTLKILKIRDLSRKKTSRLQIHNLETPQIKEKQDTFRIRYINNSIDIKNSRLRKRDESPESPKRILDLVSAYRQKLQR